MPLTPPHVGVVGVSCTVRAMRPAYVTAPTSCSLERCPLCVRDNQRTSQKMQTCCHLATSLWACPIKLSTCDRYFYITVHGSRQFHECDFCQIPSLFKPFHFFFLKVLVLFMIFTLSFIFVSVFFLVFFPQIQLLMVAVWSHV